MDDWCGECGGTGDCAHCDGDGAKYGECDECSGTGACVECDGTGDAPEVE